MGVRIELQDNVMIRYFPIFEAVRNACSIRIFHCFMNG